MLQIAWNMFDSLKKFNIIELKGQYSFIFKI